MFFWFNLSLPGFCFTISQTLGSCHWGKPAATGTAFKALKALEIRFEPFERLLRIRDGHAVYRPGQSRKKKWTTRNRE